MQTLYFAMHFVKKNIFNKIFNNSALRYSRKTELLNSRAD